MEFHDLEIFSAVVESGGFNKAAKRLLLTQSAVSQAIARMERRIGTAVLVRSTPPTLTAAGTRVLDSARRMFEEVNTLERDLADIARPSGGRVRLGASQAVTNLYLGDIVKKFVREYAHISLDIANVASRELLLKVKSGECEIGLGPFQQDMLGFVCHPYYKQVLRLYAGKRHAGFADLRKGKEAALKEAMLLTSYLDPIENRPSQQRLRYRFAGVWQIESLNLRLRMIADGLGIGYLPEIVVRRSEFAGRMSALSRFEYSRHERQVGIYTWARRRPSPIAQTVVDFCDAFFKR